MAESAKIIVVVPTYNERENLPVLAALLSDLKLPGLQMLVVDDNSPDGTGDVADELAKAAPTEVSVLHRTEKDGLGRAYIAGISRALDENADIVIADITGENPNVMYELGYAQRADKPTVILNQRVEASSFDLRDWRQVPYSPSPTNAEQADLSRHLVDAIRMAETRAASG